MPQTMEEHLDDMEEEASENDRVSISSFDDAEVSPTKNLIPVLVNVYQSKMFLLFFTKRQQRCPNFRKSFF